MVDQDRLKLQMDMLTEMGKKIIFFCLRFSVALHP